MPAPRSREVADLLARRNVLEVRLRELESGRQGSPWDEAGTRTAEWSSCKAHLDRVQARLDELGVAREA